ncbi:MAG: hypothetical protein KGJ23_16055 [Euryarchaeota archaeon]|nr:hypothetical protein [Euryarchaeota archaeon]MDE1838112.1 hypothetical protein [Euryarchaeota archaeon]MDE2046589.1 hypothetical protein [Thermoplasmata archaeon]
MDELRDAGNFAPTHPQVVEALGRRSGRRVAPRVVGFLMGALEVPSRQRMTEEGYVTVYWVRKDAPPPWPLKQVSRRALSETSPAQGLPLLERALFELREEGRDEVPLEEFTARFGGAEAPPSIGWLVGRLLGQMGIPRRTTGPRGAVTRV